MDHLQSVKTRVREAHVALPPEPWATIGTANIPGITEVGFDDEKDLLLVLSSQARLIIDCRSGTMVARDAGIEHRSSWYGQHDLVANGFGPLHGRRVALAGACGGGLPAFSRDGWGAVRVPLDWPDENILLTAPFSSIYRTDVLFWKLAVVREPVAFGYSYSGLSLILATAEEVTVWGRAEDDKVTR